MHLLAGSQRGDQGSVGNLIYNVPVRAVGQLGSATYSWSTTGKAGSGADELLGKGDFVLTGRGRGIVRFQAPMLRARDWGRLPRSHQRRLDLPHPVALTPKPVTPTATDLSDDDLMEMAEAFQEGASIRSVMRDWKIGYDRAKQIQEIVLEEVSIEQ